MKKKKRTNNKFDDKFDSFTFKKINHADENIENDKFTDIFNGKHIIIWKDYYENHYFQIKDVTISFIKEEWDNFKNELSNFNDL